MCDPIRKDLLIFRAVGSIVPKWTVFIINDTPVVVRGFVAGTAKECQKVVHVLHLFRSVKFFTDGFICGPAIHIIKPELFPFRRFISNEGTTAHDLLIRVILELDSLGVNCNKGLSSQITSDRLFLLLLCDNCGG